MHIVYDNSLTKMDYPTVPFFLYQDNQGVIWIGSCDGLNMYDGNSIHAYNPPNSSKTLLSGNLINNFMETGKNVLWIQTNYGLDRLDLKNNKPELC